METPYRSHDAESGRGGAPATLGTFLGVFVPCTCTIFGVVVFLRLGFVVGQAGVWATLAIIGGAFVLCLLTTLSLCSLISDGGAAIEADLLLARQGHTKDPGIYRALRQSVGPEFGALLGIAFYLAFVVDVAWYLTGFAENVVQEFSGHSHVQVFPWNPPGTWLSTVVASVALAIITAVASRGVYLTARVSLVVLVAIVLCILISLLCLLWPTDDPESGPTAPSLAHFLNNSWPDLTEFNGYEKPTLPLMFVLVFPGFTGVLAGSNLSGDLVAPTRSIAQGTLCSLLFVVATYAAICLTLAATVEREVLKTNLRIMDTVVTYSLHMPLGQVGVACTTLSSALSYALGAPRVLQAVCRDAGWRWLSTPGYEEGWRREPLRAVVLTWVLVELILLTGTINELAPLVSGLFLLTFTFLNLLAFVAGVSRRSFAPNFRCHSRWTALAGFLLTFMAMAWALAETYQVAAGLGGLFVVLLVWKRKALLQLGQQGAFLGGGDDDDDIISGSRRLSCPTNDAHVQDRIDRAAICVHDAMRGTFLGRTVLTRSLKRVKSRATLRAARVIRHGAMAAYMALSFFERPVWCYGLPSCEVSINGTVHVAPTLELWVMPLWMSQLIEASCVLVFFWEMSHKVRVRPLLHPRAIPCSTLSEPVLTGHSAKHAAGGVHVS